MAGKLTEALKAGKSDVFQQVTKHLSPAVGKFSENIADYAKGTYVWTTDGTKHLDFASGIGTQSVGHCHPRVVAAIQDQASKFIHAQQNLLPASQPMIGLLDRLLKICPKDLTRFFFANSGSEAVDNAIKIARGHTGRQNIIAFEGGYHGRTYGAMALTSSKTVYRQGFGPVMPQTFIAQYPYCLHCKVRQASPSGSEWYKLEPNIPPYDSYESRHCCKSPVDSLKWMLKMQTAPSETAAIIIEPILGEGGFLCPPPGFLPAVQAICKEHGIMLIIDEVQSGVGRTGKWWAHEHLGELDPDIMIFAKGIASGFPLAGLATKDNLYDGLPPGTMGGTYGANPIGLAAACATLDVIQDEGLLENATLRGRQLVQGLVDLSERFPIVDIRGRGLMVALEFGGPTGGLVADPGTASAVTAAAAKRNMLLMGAGARESIRFLPPLNVSEAEIDSALSIFGECLEEVFETESK